MLNKEQEKWESVSWIQRNFRLGYLTAFKIKEAVEKIRQEEKENMIKVIEGMSMPVGSEGAEKRAYDQAISEIIKELK
ncbi:MAG TPA: hypothetical protein ENI29_01025, partial [bacterium]|nr:hypothetical protein [bacterium]